MQTTLAGKTVVVTGATAGIGQAAAEILAGMGAFVIGAGRSAERCQQARQQILSTQPGAHVEFCVADLAMQSEVRRLAAEIREKVSRFGTGALDGLINNAGGFNWWFTLTPEGFEMQWAVNHLAPFLLTHELLPLLKVAPNARVVTVSSGSHYGVRLKWGDIQLRRHYNGLRAYQQTKLANVLFTAELNRRLGSGSTVRAFAADPGLVMTDIGSKSNPGLARWVWQFRRKSGISPEESARGVVFLVSEPSIQNSLDVYWKHGVPKSPNPYALEEEPAWRLWALSQQMCGIKDEPGGPTPQDLPTQANGNRKEAS